MSGVMNATNKWPLPLGNSHSPGRWAKTQVERRGSQEGHGLWNRGSKAMGVWRRKGAFRAGEPCRPSGKIRLWGCVKLLRVRF